ncbi:Mrr N-terminal domain-containing protein [Maridesulfovibrio ferrireducens]|uniref:Mrr N-terminal domain-containing protein n=1 Tax=Maridesulfovibrio ferrireducens TaxID=246191 RepID=A0A1G9IXF2_9BACT|nr:winged helix-turn-helix domain-containing protein [Maridesulfovibrio ferrireducens]SDL29633.1 Mrr N-terminal domain-containing protein [Maridesulfovibrio ferrireducens]
MINTPKFYDLMTPVLRVLESLGGSANILEITEHIVNHLYLTEKAAKYLNNPGRTHQTKLECRIYHANKYLCCYGVLEEIEPDIWGLTDKYEPGMIVTHDHIIKAAMEKLTA